MRGNVALSIRVVEKSAGGTFCGALRIVEGDELLAMPYSAYSFACEYSAGRPPPQPGLCARVPVPPGHYDVRVAPVTVDDANLGFAVFLSPAAGDAAAPEAIPTISAALASIACSVVASISVLLRHNRGPGV